MVWAADLFYLPRRSKEFLTAPYGMRDYAVFGACLVIFGSGLVFPDGVPIAMAHLGLFIFLAIHLGRRFRLEHCAAPVGRDHQAVSEQRALFVFIGILLKWFWCVLLVSFLIETIDLFFPAIGLEDLAKAALLSFVAAVVMVMFAAGFARRFEGCALTELLGLTADRAVGWIWWALPVLFGIACAAVASVLFFHDSYQPVTPFSELIDWVQVPWVMIVFLGVAVIAAPFLEEIIFRGFFFKVLQKHCGFWRAFWAVGLLFGALHIDQYWGDWIGISVILVLGVLLTALRAFSGSTLPAVVLHYTFNIFMVILPAAFFVMSRPVFSEYYLQQESLSFVQKKDLLEQSLKEDDANALAYDELARLYLEQGAHLHQALAYADEALRLMPERTIFQYTRAEILAGLGRTGEAIKILEDILRAMPDNQKVRDLLQKVSAAE